MVLVFRAGLDEGMSLRQVLYVEANLSAFLFSGEVAYLLLYWTNCHAHFRRAIKAQEIVRPGISTKCHCFVHVLLPGLISMQVRSPLTA